MFRRPETHVVVLSDRDSVRTALSAALKDSPAVDAPGLRRALQVVDSLASDPDEVRARWVIDLLEAANVDVLTHEVSAVRVLRQRVPGLGLAAATSLAAEAKRHLTQQRTS
jgi:hypothetical protein